MPPEKSTVGKRGSARRSTGPRATILSGLKKVTAVPFQPLLCVQLQFKVGKVPALIDTGAQFSCVRANVAEFLYLMGEPCSFTSCSVECALADGQRCHVTNAVNLHPKLLSFSWLHEFKVLNGGPFPAILGIDFLRRTQMMVNAATKTFSFGFAPGKIGHFSRCEGERERQPYLQGLLRETSGRLQRPGHHCRIPLPVFFSAWCRARGPLCH